MNTISPFYEHHNLGEKKKTKISVKFDPVPVPFFMRNIAFLL